uniref:Basic nuclear protein n=1 Tax=Pyrocystis lunula TaxID=2972 RepID=Q8GZE6_PYRLU|nr:basic nuclear protein [Pyrocystis lunula]
MAPKAMKGAVMGKAALADALATGCELKRRMSPRSWRVWPRSALGELKKSAVFTLPGICRIKTRRKPATKAGKREVFGKVVMVKAKPAKTVVKAFPVAALKKQF